MVRKQTEHATLLDVLNLVPRPVTAPQFLRRRDNRALVRKSLHFGNL